MDKSFDYINGLLEAARIVHRLATGTKYGSKFDGLIEAIEAIVTVSQELLADKNTVSKAEEHVVCR